MTVILPSARAFRVLALSCLALLLGSALSAGTLVVDLATGPAVNVDLTAEGTLDWAVWGSQTVSLGPDVRKASGAVFGDLVDLSNGNPLELALRVGRFDHSFSWSDGSPVAAGSGVLSGLGHTDMIPGGGADPVGEGFLITIPADTQEKTLRLYVRNFFSETALTADLSDGSGPGYLGILPRPPLFPVQCCESGLYTIRFAADSPGQFLTLRYITIVSYQSGLDGWASIHAASLEAPVQVPATPPIALAALALLSTLVGAALLRQLY